VIANPLPIFEDAQQQTVPLTGILRGRAGGPPPRITAISSQTSVIASATVQYTDLSTTGSLRFTPVADASGTLIITVTVTDAGADQLMDTSDDGILTRSFTVTVLPVNDQPTFSVPADPLNVNEDAGGQSVPNFITNITRGGGTFELGQTLSAFIVTPSSSSAALFQVPPAIDASGRLTFTGAPNAFGSAFIFVTLRDDGGKENNGLDTSSNFFGINFIPINDAPSFTIGSNQSSQASSGARTVTSFATGFQSGGGTFESTQIISEFVVTNNNPSIFTSQPTIDTSGTLRYTPSSTTGTANVSVRVRDNGGTLNNGIDISSISTFTISVQPAILPPTVQSVVFGDGTSQRSMVRSIVLDFNSVVTFLNSSFMLERKVNSVWMTIPAASLAIAGAPSTFNSGTQSRATLTFSGTEAIGGSLADGIYRLTVLASGITNSQGTVLDGDANGTAGGNFIRGEQQTDNFFRLFGDTNSSRSITPGELNQFIATNGRTSTQAGFDSRFDANSSNTITPFDLNQFISRNGRSLNFGTGNLT